MAINHDTGPNASTSPNINADPNIHDIDQNNPTAERDGAHIPEADAAGYRIREEPFGTKRPVRVVVMGAGASALNFLKKAEEGMRNLSVRVYEKNGDVGGTWFEVSDWSFAIDLTVGAWGMES